MIASPPRRMTPTSDLIVGLYESIFLSIRTKLQEPDQAGRQIDLNVPSVGILSLRPTKNSN
jgi:hypothetical protein